MARPRAARKVYARRPLLESCRASRPCFRFTGFPCSIAGVLTLRHLAPVATLALLTLVGCGRNPAVSADGLPLRRVVIYRNGVGYFERVGRVEESEVRFKVKESEVGDFLATLAVSETGGSSVRSVAFPLKVEDDDDASDKSSDWDKAPKPKPRTEDDKRGLKQVVMSLDGKAHDLEVGYVAESPVWRPSYRLVVEKNRQAYLQAWGVVQNLSGEDWRDVKLSLVAGAPLAFEAQLGEAIVPARPVVTDHGEVIAAVPKGETSLRQEGQGDRDGDGIADAEDRCPDEPETLNGVDDEDGCPDRGRVVVSAETEEDAPDEDAAPRKRDKKEAEKTGKRANKPRSTTRRPLGKVAGGKGGPPSASAPASPPPPPPKTATPRSLRSLAAIAVEAGTTRYDLPLPVTIPDKSATMVMLLSKRIPGEALFLFAPDSGVPDSASHPFRVVRFTNSTQGVLERGPIAVFEQGSFLGQGMVDPLPASATATVPFALERALAVDQEQKREELGERIAKIENGELTIERDDVRQTKYRLRNGSDQEAKMLLRHPRINGARLHQPPPETEDNVGTHTALVPGRVKARSTTQVVVDERLTSRRREDWFTIIADNAVKAYLADARADRGVVQKLTPAWVLRKEIVERHEARAKLAQEQATLTQQTRETRLNLRAIEKNKTAAALRAKLTARLGEMSARLDVVSKGIVEIDSKLAELRIQFKELLRDLVVTAPLPPK